MKLALFALAAPAFPETLVVDASGGGDFLEVQPAVDAAVGGDTILVLDHYAYQPWVPNAGVYAGFVVDGKAIDVVASPGWDWSIAGVTVRGIASGDSVTLRGLPVEGDVRVEGCAGAVRLEQLRTPSTCALEVTSSRDVSLADVVVRGSTFVPGGSLFGGVEPPTTGPVFTSMQPARVVEPAAIERARHDLEVTVEGEPGDIAFVLVSETSGYVPFGREEGALVVGLAFLGGRRGYFLDLGVGTASIRVPLPALPANEVTTYHAQAAIVDSAGALLFTPVRTAIVLGDDVPVFLGGEVARVDDSAAPGGDGRSWGTAHDALERALVRAWSTPAAPASVRVGRDTYRVRPETTEGGFIQRAGVDLLGSFEGTESDPSERSIGPATTTLTGDRLGNDAFPFLGYGDNAHELWLPVPPVDPDAPPRVDTVDRIAFQGVDGGDTVAFVVQRPLRIDRCEFRRNRARRIMDDDFDLHDVRITNSTFVGNDGAAMFFTNARIEQCLVMNNRTVDRSIVGLW